MFGGFRNYITEGLSGSEYFHTTPRRQTGENPEETTYYGHGYRTGHPGSNTLYQQPLERLEKTGIGWKGPQYEIPQEALDIMSTYEESADYLRDTSQEITDIANYNRNLAEVRGMGGLGADISQAESNVMGRAVSVGGASTSSMGIASELRSQSISSMRDAAIQAQASRQQKEEEYKNTVLSQGGAEIAASEMGIKGKQEMLRQREQEFQINVLDPYYFKQQKELIELSKQPESGGLSFLNPKNW